MTEKKKPDLDDDATFLFATRFVMLLAAVVATAVVTAIVVGVVALVRWVL